MSWAWTWTPVEPAVPPEVAWGLPLEASGTIGSGTVSVAGLSGFTTSLISSGRHLKAKGNRRASVLGFGVVEGDGITLV